MKTATVTLASGATRVLPDDIDAARVAGLDPRGRIVVDDFDARATPLPAPEDYTFADAPFLFGLTLCCNAYDKGVEDGVVCRGCYSYDEVGAYFHRAADGTFPGVDPVVSVDTVTTVSYAAAADLAAALHAEGAKQAEIGYPTDADRYYEAAGELLVLIAAADVTLPAEAEALGSDLGLI